ncbi:hypothetical protein BDQ17DRAFT_1440439 [Cyathus striatus]|nr:hypothetical protein BDQ17DRAFT_1440439 [Cyathus striatus]
MPLPDSTLNVQGEFKVESTVKIQVDQLTHLDTDTDSGDSSANEENYDFDKVRPGKLQQAPMQLSAKATLDDIKNILCPPRKVGSGYMDPELDMFIRTRVQGMQAMLALYTHSQSSTYGAWGASSIQAAITLNRGLHCARRLHALTRQFIKDRNVLPINLYGKWKESMLADENLTNDLNIYLQEIGNETSGKKVQEYLCHEDVQSKHGIDRKICECTAQQYLNELGYRFTEPKKGQYVDGHENPTVVDYRDNIYVQEWKTFWDRMMTWTKDNIPEHQESDIVGHHAIVWFHDESVFYAHDRRKKSWFHKDTPAKPYAKDEGASLMIADFVSADFG